MNNAKPGLPICYIASPYTKGDVALNVRAQIDAYMALLDSLAVLPIAPLLCHFVQMIHPHDYAFWFDRDLEYVKRADCVLMVPAEAVVLSKYGAVKRCDFYFQSESAGADKEEALALKLGKPVFGEVLAVIEWAQGFTLSPSVTVSSESNPAPPKEPKALDWRESGLAPHTVLLLLLYWNHGQRKIPDTQWPPEGFPETWHYEKALESLFAIKSVARLIGSKSIRINSRGASMVQRAFRRLKANGKTEFLEVLR